MTLLVPEPGVPTVDPPAAGDSLGGESVGGAEYAFPRVTVSPKFPDVGVRVDAPVGARVTLGLAVADVLEVRGLPVPVASEEGSEPPSLAANDVWVLEAPSPLLFVVGGVGVDEGSCPGELNFPPLSMRTPTIRKKSLPV